MSKHFLFVMWEGGGTVAPELGVARKLMGRGHRVTVLGDDSLRPEIESSGATFAGYEHAPNRLTKAPEHDVLRDWEESDPMEVIFRVIDRIMCGPALGVAKDVLAVHEKDAVDCVAGCAFRLGATMAAERAGIPGVVLFPNLDFRPADGRPGFGPGFHPMEGPEGEARDREVWAMNRALFGRGQPALDRARRELGLDPTTHLWDEYDRADRVLLLTSRHFEYPYPLPPNTVFAGPVLDDPLWADRDAAFLPGDSRPLVLVSLGSSFQNQLDQYRRIVEAFRGLPAAAVVTLGGVFDPAELAPPQNVRVVRSAPHGPLLERASVVVSHCGHGSVMKSLAAGVPMLCLPISREQPENAAHVEWLGAGLRLDAGASSDAIRSALVRILEEDSFREKARGLGSKLGEEIGEDVAIRELEQMVEAGPAHVARH